MYFWQAYGLSGAGGMSSVSGSVGWSPYTDDDDEYTTRRTPASTAAFSTRRLPVTLTACVPMGSSIERGTRASAAVRKTTARPSRADVKPSESTAISTSQSGAVGFKLRR